MKLNKLNLTLLTLAAGLLFLPLQSQANLSLEIKDTIPDASPFSVDINPGDSFNITISSILVNEQLIGIDYTFDSDTINLYFELVNRTVLNPYTDVVNSDSEVEGTFITTIDSDSLGGLLQNISVPVTTNESLANYTIDTPINIPAGQYHIYISGFGVGDEFESVPANTNFNSNQGYVVNVVPEPSTIISLIGGLGFLGMIRRRN